MAAGICDGKCSTHGFRMYACHDVDVAVSSNMVVVVVDDGFPLPFSLTVLDAVGRSV